VGKVSVNKDQVQGKIDGFIDNLYILGFCIFFTFLITWMWLPLIVSYFSIYELTQLSTVELIFNIFYTVLCISSIYSLILNKQILFRIGTATLSIGIFFLIYKLCIDTGSSISLYVFLFGNIASLLIYELLLSNISKELMNACNDNKMMDLYNKLYSIDSLILKYIATAQSLYV
jgi:hypothetical protein